MNLDVKQIKYGQIKAVNLTMKLWLQDNNIEMQSTHNEGKSVFALLGL